MKTKSLLLLWLMLLVGASGLRASEMELYAELSKDKKTLTFYYDTYRSSRTGTTYDLNTGTTVPEWYSYASSVTEVEFDSSFTWANPTSCSSWFRNMSNLTSITGLWRLNTTNVTNMAGMFANCTSLKSLDLTDFNTANVTDMSFMFWGCHELTSLKVSSFNTSKVTDMSYMFNDCFKLQNLNLSSFTFKSGLKSSSLFLGARELTLLVIPATAGNLGSSVCNGVGTQSAPCTLVYPDVFTPQKDDTGNGWYQWKEGYFKDAVPVAYFSYNDDTFSLKYDNQYNGEDFLVPDDGNNGKSIYNIDDDVPRIFTFESSFANYKPTNTSNWFRQMGFAFDPNTQFYLEGMENLNTSKVTNMSYMFYHSQYGDCLVEEEKALDLSHFDTHNVTDMSYMFAGFIKYSHVIYDGDEFNNGSYSLGTLDISSFTINASANTSYMFKDAKIKVLKVPASAYNLASNACQGVGTADNPCTLVYPAGFPLQTTESGDGWFKWKGGFFKDAQPEAYAVLDGSTLTFYYDIERDSHIGTTYDLNTGGNYPEWHGNSSSVTKVVFDTSFATARPTSCFGWFCDMSNLTSITGIENLKTESVTNMDYMFSGCTNLRNLDVSGFNTSKVTTMVSMFNNCPNLSSLDVSGFSTTNVTDMSCMFNRCSSLTTLDVSHFNTSKVTNMGGMFEKCSGLQIIDVSHFNTSKLECMLGMFQDCTGLQELDLSSFSIPDSTDYVSLATRFVLYNCTSLKRLTIPMMSRKKMFSSDACSGVGTKSSPCTLVYPDGFTPRKDAIGVGWYLWRGGYFMDPPEAYAVLDGSTLTFYYDLNSASHTSTPYGLNTGTNNPGWYSSASSVTKVVFDTSFSNARPTSCFRWFSDMTYLTSITGIEYLKTDSVTNMQSMFASCSRLQSLDLSGFNTANVTDMGAMFSYCTSLETLDVSNFDTSKVLDMGYMFDQCSSLTSLDLSSFNTASVNYMNSMFTDCSSLTSLDLSSFTFSSTTKTSYFLYFSNHLETLTIPETAGYLNNNACSNVGSEFAPCTLIYPPNFTPQKDDTGDGWYLWKSGYFKDAEPAAYTVLDGTTLTFYYDTAFGYRIGTVYELNTSTSEPEWREYANHIECVVFDASFAEARPTCCFSWFNGMTNLTSITGFNNLHTEEVTDMGYLFSCCSALTNLDLSGFNTTNVVYMDGMFLGCSGLTSLDLSSFDTSNVAYMDVMFQNCSNLASLDLSSFTFNKETTTHQLLFDCIGLKKLTIPETAGYLNDNACSNVGSKFAPCTLIYPPDFTPQKDDTGDGWYLWKSGYFKDAGLLGDVNGDRAVTITDVSMTVGYVVGNTQAGFIKANADINGDRDINISDVMGIVQMVIN